MEHYHALLPDYIRNKSISTDPQFKGGIAATVAWLRNLFEGNGFTVTVVEGYGNPVVVAKYVADPKYQTCLIYGHYDVQPANIEDGWTADPFAVSKRDGRIYCRGAVDNKGQNLIHIVSILGLIKEGKLGYNITFMIEGDEETGSPMLPRLIADKKALLKADFTLVSDGELTAEMPTIETGFRGGFNLTLAVTTSDVDLHSGIFGGAAPNAAHELAKLVATLYDNHNRIAIPGFYDGVDEITSEMRANNENIPFEYNEYQRISGTRQLLTEPGYDFYTQTGLLPAVQVTGITSGYTGEGYRNGIPASATAKINFRLVLHQDPHHILQVFKDYLKATLPSYAASTIDLSDPYEGIKIDTDNSFVRKAQAKLAEAYGKQPVLKYCGGGLPIVTLYHDILGIPNVLVPLANEDCHMHAVDENFRVDYIEKGIAFSRSFFGK